ncbi:hypothetical protein [Candidatus Venteria ishoeyi]|uniref:Uncharacterized protein n=1 Tax=Candidatus Venteria ishoeyi TaxID=1899563 RepID=A0A1H6FFP4_9GAMM|nr:hypothetical protein [Candidatus Venteria ishoeyi]SEH08898.1 Uncharacterised protein [Candidatus Venteria ishoeyi]
MKKQTQNALIGAAMLVGAPAAMAKGAGTATGGKGMLGVNHLSLDEMPGANMRMCSNDETNVTGSNLVSNDLTIAIDPFASSYIELVFTVSDIPANDQDHVLFLVASNKESLSPQIPTPRSINDFKLDMSGLEILAIYDVKKQSLMHQGKTRWGQANPAPTSKVSFKVNLDTATLPTMMRNGENVVYLQAAMLRSVDYSSGSFDNMILSEMDKLTFAQNDCPGQFVAMDSSGQFTAGQDANTTKTKNTTSNSTSSSTKSGK